MSSAHTHCHTGEEEVVKFQLTYWLFCLIELRQVLVMDALLSQSAFCLLS